jgi:WD40 repeat protein
MPEVRGTHPSLEELTAFDRGQLCPAEREAVERHVADCDSCCHRLDSIGDDDLVVLLRTSAGLTAPTVEVSPGPRSGDTPQAVRGDTLAELPAELADHPRYHVICPLGAGGMGVVFKAEHRLMERAVALKIIHKDLTQRPGAVERFRQEVKAAARLSHPNIATAHDAEQAGDTHFLVMEYVEGRSLDRVVQAQGPLPAALAAHVGRQTALGLQHAHERGMIHRDVKPQNLLLTPAGQVKILDFGLARLCSDGGSATVPGVVVGTPDYLAPEQALDAHRADARADIYSLGCTLYFLLAGRPPFPEGSALQKLLAHQQRTPPSLAALRPDVPPGLVHVIERMMAKDPAQRCRTAAEVAEQLAPFATDLPLAAVGRPVGRSRHRYGLALSVAAAAFLSAGLLCIFLVWRQREMSRTTEEVPLPRGIEPLAEGETRRVVSPVNPCFRALLAPSSRRALLAGLDNSVYLWDLGGEGGGDDLTTLKGHTARPMSFALTRDGRRALSGGMDNTVRLWDVEQRRLLRTFEEHTGWVRGVDFVAGTALAVSADNNGAVLLWDTRDGRRIHGFAGHEGAIYSVAASPSGLRAVSAGEDGWVRVWDLVLMHQAFRLRGSDDRATCAALSADDRLVVSGGADRVVRVWDLTKERVRWALHGHGATINAVAISPDGRRALSADQAGGIRLWDLETGAPLCEYKTAVDQILRAIAFDPDSKSIVSAGEDGVFRFWRQP